MRSRVSMLAVVALLAIGLAVPAAATASPGASNPNTTLNATLQSATGPITGTLSNLVFTVNQAGQLVVSGTFTDAVGNVTNFVTTVLNTGGGSCQILDLTLGPLDLNLLGLMVHLDTVHLNITAQSGPGNLLGNLLCGVAHLLDSNGNANALANVLNHLLGGL